MIYTSYFAKLRKMPESIVPISICAKPPQFYTGIQYKVLAPSYSCLMNYKATKNEDAYIEQYTKEILDKLDPIKVKEDLMTLSGGKDVAMICFEKSEDFCHRHLIAKWMQNHGIDVKEFDT